MDSDMVLWGIEEVEEEGGEEGGCPAQTLSVKTQYTLV